MALFGRADINEGVRTCRETEGAVLVDVRDRDEYAQGQIAGSINIPLRELQLITDAVPDLDTPLFVHCLAGTRSAQAVMMFKRMGYTDARNIGGIQNWKGEVEKGSSW